MGANIQGRLWPRNDEEKKKAIEQGYDLKRVSHAFTLYINVQSPDQVV